MNDSTQPQTPKRAQRIVIDVDRDGWTKHLQMNIVQLDENGSGHGYRLAGPKYNGSSKNLLRCELDERDAREIRQYLDAAFPTAPTPVIDRETAAHVLWMFGQNGGYPPGDYMQDLLTLIARSDMQNTARFALGFPVQTAAVRLAKYDETGIAQLQTIAAREVAA
jgi:hypothetical protein